MKGTVSSMSVTKTGKVLLYVFLPSGGEGKVLLREEQLRIFRDFFDGVPRKGTVVEVSWAVNPDSGEVSTEWLEISL